MLWSNEFVIALRTEKLFDLFHLTLIILAISAHPNSTFNLTKTYVGYENYLYHVLNRTFSLNITNTCAMAYSYLTISY